MGFDGKAIELYFGAFSNLDSFGLHNFNQITYVDVPLFLSVFSDTKNKHTLIFTQLWVPSNCCIWCTCSSQSRSFVFCICICCAAKPIWANLSQLRRVCLSSPCMAPPDIAEYLYLYCINVFVFVLCWCVRICIVFVMGWFFFDNGIGNVWHLHETCQNSALKAVLLPPPSGICGFLSCGEI